MLFFLLVFVISEISFPEVACCFSPSLLLYDIFRCSIEHFQHLNIIIPLFLLCSGSFVCLCLLCDFVF
uniref:Uncharacterized protein n=1 Tax=Nelumbo nucifera TaxID=4432 RepID=A0A822ZE46_NELNU|nr:TPA_asm: hypothetical protein HUJ06_001397 [Nelumbo nucifera]